MPDNPRRSPDPRLREFPPGLYYATHTVQNNPDIVDRLTQDVILKPRSKLEVNPADEFDDPERPIDFFESAELVPAPPTRPPIIISADRFDRRDVKVSTMGYEVHTFRLYSATLSLPDNATGLPDFTRCDAILQVVTDGEKGELINVDSLARIEDGVQRDQTWAFARDEFGEPKVHQHWRRHVEDDNADELEERSAQKTSTEMMETPRANADQWLSERRITTID
ncbi:hypothetical protein BC629DRAFT_1590420 [Irpex lacteus]|nr:hypothetical protein BC629DRAFT_1590420 [Irpex lacteus]